MTLLKRKVLLTDEDPVKLDWGDDEYNFHRVVVGGKQPGSSSPVIRVRYMSDTTALATSGLYLQTYEQGAVFITSNSSTNYIGRGSGLGFSLAFDVIKDPVLAPNKTYFRSLSHNVDAAGVMTRCYNSTESNMLVVTEAYRNVTGFQLRDAAAVSVYGAGTVIEVYGTHSMVDLFK
ncbi:hypothetical protein K0U83_06490 [bacterium]|nr:hypothetical protein [bacterium]